MDAAIIAGQQRWLSGPAPFVIRDKETIPSNITYGGRSALKTAGIVGGIGPESTIEYYRLIIASYRARKRDGSYPHIIVNSIDLKRLVDLVEANKLPEVAEYLLGEVRRLHRAGADFAALAANTPHVVFDALRQQSPIPLISIVEVTVGLQKRWG